MNATPPPPPPVNRQHHLRGEFEGHNRFINHSAVDRLVYLRPGMTIMAYHHGRDASFSSLDSWLSEIDGSSEALESSQLQPRVVGHRHRHSSMDRPPTELVLTQAVDRLQQQQQQSEDEEDDVTAAAAAAASSFMVAAQILACSSPEIHALCSRRSFAETSERISTALVIPPVEENHQSPLNSIPSSSATSCTPACIEKNLCKMHLFRSESDTTSSTSATTISLPPPSPNHHHTASGASVRRPSLHRRLSFPALPPMALVLQQHHDEPQHHEWASGGSLGPVAPNSAGSSSREHRGRNASQSSSLPSTLS